MNVCSRIRVYVCVCVCVHVCVSCVSVCNGFVFLLLLLVYEHNLFQSLHFKNTQERSRKGEGDFGIVPRLNK